MRTARLQALVELQLTLPSPPLILTEPTTIRLPPRPSQPLRQSPSGLSLSLSSDNESFSVERDVAIRSVLIKNMIEGELSGVVARKAPAGLGRC